MDSIFLQSDGVSTKVSAVQLTRYRKALDNLILTDYVEFRWYGPAS
jgi:hypothetical protein